MVRLHHSLVDFLDQHLAADFLSQRRMVVSQEAAFAGLCLDDADAFQLGICFGNRIAINSQFLGKWPDVWKRFSRLQGARRRCGFDLVDDLQIDGLAGLVIDLDQHNRTLS